MWDSHRGQGKSHTPCLSGNQRKEMRSPEEPAEERGRDPLLDFTALKMAHGFWGLAARERLVIGWF